MHAIQVREFGPPEQLEWTELPDPVPGPGEVLVAVEAAGVNRADVLFRSGGYHRAPPLPAVPGVEGAGTVVQLGSGAHGVDAGDRVAAWGATGAPGFYTELAAVAADRTVAVPAGVDIQAAAALPTASLSAWYCMHRLAELQPDETVLVHAGASGVGSAAVQIVKNAGATVIATAGSPEKQAWVRELGADHVLDHRSADIAAEVSRLTDGRGADVVLDLVGGSTFAVSLRAVARAGRVVAMANVALAPSTIDTRDFYPKNVRIYGFQVTDLIEHGWDPRPDLTELLGAVEKARFTVPIDSTFPLEQAPAAHRRLESRAAKGKIMLVTAVRR